MLDGDIVPGTVVVRADGGAVGGAEVDYGGGTVTLPQLSESAVVDVSYRVYDSGSEADIVALSGNRFRFGDSTEATLAAGLRWTPGNEGFSTAPEQHPGLVTLSVGAEHEGEELSAEAAAALQLSQSDTTGLYRLFGGGRTTSSFTPRAETLFPAAQPSDGALTAAVAAGFDRAPLPPAERVVPIYRDYWENDPISGPSLLSYTTSRSARPRDSGEPIGPYLASSFDAGYSGPVGLLEWSDGEIDGDGWVGATVRTTGAPRDLRAASRVTVRYRYLSDDDSAGQPALLIQLGTLAEDLDDDGTADEGASGLSPLLEYNWPDGTRYGGGQDAPALVEPHREDRDRDGSLVSEAGESLVSRVVDGAGAVTSDGWRVLSFEPTPAERAALSDVTGVRVVVANDDAVIPLADGRLLIGRSEVELSETAVVVADAGGSASVSVGDDPFNGSDALEKRFAVVGGRLLGDSDDNDVTTVSWSGASGSPGDPVEVEFAIPEFQRERYRTLRLYLALTEPASVPAGATIELELAAYRGATERLRATVDADALVPGWNELEIDLAGRDVSLNGVAQPTALQRPALGSEPLQLATLRVEGISDGVLAFDELHAADAVTDLTGGASARVAWQSSFEWGSLRLEQELSGQADGFRAAGSAGPLDEAVRSTSRVEATLGPLSVGSGAAVERAPTDQAARFDHSVQLSGAGLSLDERFARDYGVDARVASRTLRLGATAEGWGSYSLATASRVDEVERRRRWEATAAAPAFTAWQVPLSLSVAADASLIEFDRTVAAADYAEAWVASWRLMAPASGAAEQERRGDGRLDLTAGSWSGRLGGGWTVRTTLEPSSDARLEFDSELPLALPRRWRMVADYDRSWSVRQERADASFGADAAWWSAQVGSEPLIATAPPFAEFFLARSSLDPERSVAARDYSAGAGLRLSQPPSSRLASLVVPALVRLSLQRELSWEADSTTDRREWQAEVGSVAVNLFGTLGSRPSDVLSTFETDEYRLRLSTTLSESPPGSTPEWEVEAGAEALLFGADRHEVALTVTAAFEGGDDAERRFEVELRRQRLGTRYPRLGFIETIEAEPELLHSQDLTTTVTTGTSGFVSSEVTAGHESRLALGEAGSIAAYGDLGWTADRAGYERGALHLIGVRIGLEGRLSY